MRKPKEMGNDQQPIPSKTAKSLEAKRSMSHKDYIQVVSEEEIENCGKSLTCDLYSRITIFLTKKQYNPSKSIFYVMYQV